MRGVRNFVRSLIIALLMFTDFLAVAQDDADVRRPVVSAYSILIGGGYVLDTYLSPLKYHGVRTGLSGEWMKAFPANQERMRMEFKGNVNTFFTKSPTGGAGIYSLAFEFGWGLMYAFPLGNEFILSAGGGPELYAGCLYTPSGSNNPASAKASLFLSPGLTISRPLRIGRLDVLISDRVCLPSAGIFFSPQYGEPYYEIWLGNHKDLVHFGWWGNHFCISNFLNFDLRLGRHALRIGYVFDVRSSWISHINTQLVSHSVSVGYIPSCFGIGARHQKNIITPCY